jgi:hypothetical protein
MCLAKYRLFNDFRRKEAGTFPTLEEAIKAFKAKGSASSAYNIYEWGNQVYPKKQKK